MHAQVNSQPRLTMTVREASMYLDLDVRTVRRLFVAGALRGNRAGRSIRLSADSVLKWVSGTT